MDIDPAPNLWERLRQEWQDAADRRRTTPTPFISVGDGAGQHLQHKDLWFEDGNVVVVVRNVWFKLYRGILARYSSVFHDMFQVADASAGDNVQGCPIVNLADSPEDLVVFFNLLFDGARSPFFIDPLYHMDFRDFRAVVRLARKYDVQHIQEEVIRRLRACYPSKVEEWDHRYPESCSSDSGVFHRADTLDVNPIDSVAVINLARSYDLNDVLPAAFFICAVGSDAKMVDEVRYGNAGIEDTEALSRDDFLRCLHGGRRCTSTTLIWDTEQFEAETDGHCTSRVPGSCQAAWLSSCGEWLKNQTAVDGDVLFSLCSWLDLQQEQSSLCATCLAALKEADTVGRRRVLEEQLNDIFCLP